VGRSRLGIVLSRWQNGTSLIESLRIALKVVLVSACPRSRRTDLDDVGYRCAGDGGRALR